MSLCCVILDSLNSPIDLADWIESACAAAEIVDSPPLPKRDTSQLESSNRNRVSIWVSSTARFPAACGCCASLSGSEFATNTGPNVYTESDVGSFASHFDERNILKPELPARTNRYPDSNFMELEKRPEITPTRAIRASNRSRRNPSVSCQRPSTLPLNPLHEYYVNVQGVLSCDPRLTTHCVMILSLIISVLVFGPYNQAQSLDFTTYSCIDRDYARESI